MCIRDRLAALKKASLDNETEEDSDQDAPSVSTEEDQESDEGSDTETIVPATSKDSATRKRPPPRKMGVWTSQGQHGKYQRAERLEVEESTSYLQKLDNLDATTVFESLQQKHPHGLGKNRI